MLPKSTTDLYSDAAIIICHELRKVLKLPLRQTQGFIDSIFRIQELEMRCPDFGTLSKRLERLELKTPRYKKHEKPDDDLAAIAIDSTGLKRYGFWVTPCKLENLLGKNKKR